LHLRTVKHKSILPATRLETVGSSWRVPAGIFSEYLDFIVRPEYAHAFYRALADRLQRDGRWHDLVIANSPVKGCAARFVQEYLGPRYLRQGDPLFAQRTQLPQQFGEYLAQLNGGTRRKLWNHRRRLQQPQLLICPDEGIDLFLDELDVCHASRWGKPHFVGQLRAFHRNFATAMAKTGALRMSRLDTQQGTISMLYNVRLRGAEYNIQSGFTGLSPAGTSPGYLHFGFCLEQACRDGIRSFDFLAGDGLNRDYKQDFNTHKAELATFQSIRARPLAWLYRQYDRARHQDMFRV
jgi:hypothetical protein